MRPTKEYIEQCFREINEQCFDGELPMIEICINASSRKLGCLSYVRKRRLFRSSENTDFKMTISSRYDFTDEQFRDTICHEMIHYYIAWRQIKDTAPHGEIFRSMMARINKEFGYHITISQKLTEEELDSAPRSKSYLIGISTFSNGKYGVTIAAKTRIFKLWDSMNLIPNLTDTQWYLSRDPYWDRYRSSLTPKAYLIDPSEIDAHLKDAKRLIRNGNTITTMRIK